MFSPPSAALAVTTLGVIQKPVRHVPERSDAGLIGPYSKLLAGALGFKLAKRPGVGVGTAVERESDAHLGRLAPVGFLLNATSTLDEPVARGKVDVVLVEVF